MAAWVYMACGAHGEGTIESCPQCGLVDRSRWLCCECWTEGTGERPTDCPTCGCRDSWFLSAPRPDDHRTMRAIYEDMMARLFSPSQSRH